MGLSRITAALLFTFGFVSFGFAEETKAVVMIVPSDQRDQTVSAMQAIEGQFSDLPVRLIIEESDQLPKGLEEQVELASQTADTADAFAVFWCNFLNDDQVFLYLAQAGGERILVRNLTDEDAGGQAEAIAIILRLSISAMLEGGIIGVDIKEVVEDKAAKSEIIPETKSESKPVTEAETTPGVEPEKPSRDYHVMAVGMSYSMTSYSEEHPLVHGFDLFVDVRFLRYLLATVGYTIVGEIERESELARLRLRRHPLRLGLGLVFPISDLELGACLALALDYVSFDVSGKASGVNTVTDQDDILYYLSFVIELRIPVHENIGIYLAAGGDIPLNSMYYQVEAPPDTEILIDPWPVRSRLQAGFFVKFL